MSSPCFYSGPEDQLAFTEPSELQMLCQQDNPWSPTGLPNLLVPAIPPNFQHQIVPSWIKWDTHQNSYRKTSCRTVFLVAQNNPIDKEHHLRRVCLR